MSDRMKIHAIITRRGNVVKTYTYADTTFNFVFDRPGKDYQVKYLYNKEYLTKTSGEFVGEFILGKFEVTP